MKNWKKRMAAALLTAVMAVGVVANVTPASAATLTAKQYLAKMEKASKKVKSYEAAQTVTVKVTQAGQSATSKSTTKQIVFQDPIKSKIVITTKLTADGMDQSSKIVEYLKEDTDGKIYAYISTDGSSYEETDLTDAYEKASDFDTSMYSNAKIVKKSVKVNKINTVQISAKIKGAAMGEALKALGMNVDDTEGLTIDYAKLDPINVTLWIDKKTYLPVKVTNDMTAFYNGLFKSMYEAMGEEVDINYSSAKTTLTYKNFNKATKFKFPEF